MPLKIESLFVGDPSTVALGLVLREDGTLVQTNLEQQEQRLRNVFGLIDILAPLSQSGQDYTYFNS